MKESTFRKYGVISQIAFTIVFFLINFIENFEYGFQEALVSASSYTLMVLAVVFLHYFYVLPLYLKGKKIIYFLATLSLMSVFIFLNYLTFELLPIYADEMAFFEWIEPSIIAYDYLILIICTAFTSLYYFVEQWFKNISKEANLRNEKLQTELNFLKSQINPHFLFNTLNNIYSYAQTGNKKTAPMLEKLSSILRFMVYDCSENRVELFKEIEAVQNLLDIHKMKNSEQHNIAMNTEGIKGFHLIAPLILVNFVENACKHSNVISDSSGYIKINLEVDDQDICRFEITNTYKERSTNINKYGGLGMENIKKRLQLQYNKSYELIESKDNGIYSLKLMIPLERKN